MKKRIISALAIGTLAIGIFAGCASSGSKDEGKADSSNAKAESNSEEKTIKVGGWGVIIGVNASLSCIFTLKILWHKITL